MYQVPIDGLQADDVYSGAEVKRPDAKYTGERVGRNIGASGVYLGGGPVASRSPEDEDRFAAMLPAESPVEYPGDQGRLFTSVQRSYRSLRGYRETLEKLVEDYAGTYYQSEQATTGARKNRYVNLMQQAVEAYQMLLVADRPRVMVTTDLIQYKGFARHFQHAVNALIKEIKLGDTLEQWVMDAFFGLGVIKTHLADAGVVEIETDRWMDPGRPFASNVSLDDFVYDMQATKWSEVRYAGDMYRIPYDDAVELFGEDALAEHNPSSRNTADADRVDEISRSAETGADDLEDMLDLIDLWVPKYGMTYTYVVASRDSMTLEGPGPIAVEEWTGDENGPYHLLGFHDVPENIMPSSPAANLELLESLVNDLIRKGARQARRQKDLTLYTAGGAPAMQQIQNADDGDTINVNDVNEISQLKFGGVDPGNHAYMIGGIELFDRMAGNLQAHLGLGSQSPTLGQDQLIHGAASNKIDKMRKRITGRTIRLVQSLGMMLWQDPIKEIVSEIPIQGTSISVTSVWEPGDREGNFVDFNFDIDVYSMMYQSPDSKMQKVNEILQNIIIPLAPFLQQQGGMLDMFELVKLYSTFMNLPELQDIVKFMGGSGSLEPREAMSQVPLKPPTSTRNYVRSNVTPGQNPLQQSADMMGQAAATPNPQPAMGA